MRESDRIWNQEKEERELHNKQLRHGWDGARFYEGGVRRLPVSGIIFDPDKIGVDARVTRPPVRGKK